MKLKTAIKLALVVCVLAIISSSLTCLQQCRVNEIACERAGVDFQICQSDAQDCARACP